MWTYPEPPASQTRATLRGLPPGPSGTVETLRLMRNMVRDAIRSPRQVVREKALQLVASLPPRQWFAQIRALHEFVRDEIRYVRDPVDLETVATPEKTLELRAGDCDDKSTLLAALLIAIGHPARFAALGFNRGPFSHVLVETQIRNSGEDARDWLPLETIIERDAGWYPQGVTSRYVLKV